jgi:hypothetical protein
MMSWGLPVLIEFAPDLPPARAPCPFPSPPFACSNRACGRVVGRPEPARARGDHAHRHLGRQHHLRHATTSPNAQPPNHCWDGHPQPAREQATARAWAAGSTTLALFDPTGTSSSSTSAGGDDGGWRSPASGSPPAPARRRPTSIRHRRHQVLGATAPPAHDLFVPGGTNDVPQQRQHGDRRLQPQAAAARREFGLEVARQVILRYPQVCGRRQPITKVPNGRIATSPPRTPG